MNWLRRNRPKDNRPPKDRPPFPRPQPKKDKRPKKEVAW